MDEKKTEVFEETVDQRARTELADLRRRIHRLESKHPEPEPEPKPPEYAYVCTRSYTDAGGKQYTDGAGGGESDASVICGETPLPDAELKPSKVGVSAHWRRISAEQALASGNIGKHL